MTDDDQQSSRNVFAGVGRTRPLTALIDRPWRGSAASGGRPAEVAGTTDRRVERRRDVGGPTFAPRWVQAYPGASTLERPSWLGARYDTTRAPEARAARAVAFPDRATYAGAAHPDRGLTRCRVHRGAPGRTPDHRAQMPGAPCWLAGIEGARGAWSWGAATRCCRFRVVAAAYRAAAVAQPRRAGRPGARPGFDAGGDRAAADGFTPLATQIHSLT